jgi:hypothetical protein
MFLEVLRADLTARPIAWYCRNSVARGASHVESLRRTVVHERVNVDDRRWLDEDRSRGRAGCAWAVAVRSFAT